MQDPFSNIQYWSKQSLSRSTIKSGDRGRFFESGMKKSLGVLYSLEVAKRGSLTMVKQLLFNSNTAHVIFLLSVCSIPGVPTDVQPAAVNTERKA